MAKLTQKQEDIGIPGRKLTLEEGRKKWEAQREKDYELVTGVFEYKERPGGTLKFQYAKYSDEEFLKVWTFKDGLRYCIPRMIAKHIEQDMHYVEYIPLGNLIADGTAVQRAGDATTDDGQANMYSKKKLHRASFKSLEFMDDQDSRLTEVVYL